MDNIDYLDKVYLNEGLESIVYKVGNQVYKYYKKDCSKKRLTEEEIDFFTKIKTKRILLPTNRLFDDNNSFCGYKMKYIYSEGKSSFFNLEKEKLKSELSFLREDLEILSYNHILIDDLDYVSNTIYNYGLYLIDPGSYLIKNETDNGIIFGTNLDSFNEYFINSIIHYYKNIKNRIKIKIFNSIFDEYIASNNYNIFDYFSNIKEDNLRDFITNKVKKIH